jgi:S1-C subfamily serine protease
MDRLISCGLLLAWALLPRTASAETDFALSGSVVQIHAFPGQNKVFLGSGVVVGPGRVVTNCHVTRRAHSIVVAKGSLRYSAERQQADPKRDLCLLETPGIPLPPAKLGSAARLHPGQRLHFFGFPRATGIAASEGRVDALHPFDGSFIIETSANFTFGGSGGGMFDDQGSLVGLATFLSPGRSNRYYAVPSDWIRALATLAARKIAPFEGLAFWETSASLPKFLRSPGR